MRFLFTAALGFLSCFSVSAKDGNASVEAKRSKLAGEYHTAVPDHQADSSVYAIELECNPGCKSGKYTWTKTRHREGFRDVYYKKCGDWYVLPNVGDAKNEDVLVIVFDMLGKLEQYPLFYVTEEGYLHELDQRNPERFPKEVIKLNDHIYITKKGEKMIGLDRGLMHKDLPNYHIYKK